MLDYGFRREGWCVVSAGDLVSGVDIRDCHFPAGVFLGVIGGDPCQSHSALANLVRAKGLEPSFPDMTPDFRRVIDEVQPEWFLRENVPKAPPLEPDGYDVRSFLLCNSHLDSGDGTGNEQMRKRRFWFGTRGRVCPELRAHIDFALFELPTVTHSVKGNDRNDIHFMRHKRQAVAADSRAVPVRHGGSGKVKVTAVGAPGVDYSPPRRSLGDMLELQGFPRGWMDYQPWTMAAKRKMVGNGVSLPMSRALARAIRLVLMERAA